MPGFQPINIGGATVDAQDFVNNYTQASFTNINTPTTIVPASVNPQIIYNLSVMYVSGSSMVGEIRIIDGSSINVANLAGNGLALAGAQLNTYNTLFSFPTFIIPANWSIEAEKISGFGTFALVANYRDA